VGPAGPVRQMWVSGPVQSENSYAQSGQALRFLQQPALVTISKTLTPNRPLVQTSFTYPKLNMDGFSVLNGSLGYGDSTQKIFLKFLHAEGLFQTS
jgi:hypothetical protein